MHTAGAGPVRGHIMVCGRLIRLLILSSLLSSSAYGATYYVASDGNDTSDGLSASYPWQSIAAVNAGAGLMYLYAPGGADPDTLLVEGVPVDYGIYAFWQMHNTLIEMKH